MHNVSQPTVSSIPLVRRAREYFLYTPQGQRYRDLFLAEGKLILGHTPPGYTLVAKNAIEQAMMVPYPNLWHQRLLRMLSKMFATEQVLICCESAMRQQSIVWQEPWNQQQANYVLWRPLFLRPYAPFVRLVLPVPISGICIILCSPGAQISHFSQVITTGMQARLLIKALGFWQKTLHESPTGSMARIAHAFARQAQIFGPYFFFTDDEKNHQKIYNDLLENDILIPPAVGLVGAIPMVLTQREEKILKEVLG
ncbi:MAG: hypothetical protein ACRCVN_07290 [Spirochaetia bacterium]